MQRDPFPKRAIHLDFHTMPGVYDVGRDFDPQAFAQTLQAAQVDYITVFAKCNLGFAYYPTRVGVVHPGLQQELLGPMIEACHRHSIRVAVYLNTGLDHEQALRHREWCKVNRQGQVYEMQSMGHFFRRMCLNTGWRDHLLGMVEEVLDGYPLDGLFLDCYTLSPCYGVECLDGAEAEGLDPDDDAQMREHCRRVTRAFAQEVDELVEHKAPGIYICHNGLPYRWQPRHTEIECLPGGWGYDYLPWAARYARTVGKPFFTMTGRFHKSWGDFGGIRPLHSLLFDAYLSIAHGGTVSVGDHMHPRGRLEPEAYNLVGRAYALTSQLDPWTEDARAAADIAVVEPALADTPGYPFDQAPLIGATRMLSELKQQFDVCDAEHDLTGYRALILTDHVALEEPLLSKVRAHLRAGGAMITSAASGLDSDGSGFVLEEAGVTYLGPEPHDPAYLTAALDVARGVPDMPLTIYTPGVAVQANEGTTVLAQLIQPYFNRASWNWRHENLYTPPEKDTGRPAVTQCGQVIHFSFPVFQGYHDHGVIAYRTLLGNCLERVLPDPLVRTRNVPSFGQVTVTQQERRRMVHLLAYVPELRGRTQAVEEGILLRDAEISLRTDGREVTRVYLAPQSTDLPFSMQGGYATVRVPEAQGYQLVAFDVA